MAACLQQANSTAGAVEEIGGHVTFLRQRVVDLGLDQGQPGVLQARSAGWGRAGVEGRTLAGTRQPCRLSPLWVAASRGLLRADV